MHRNAIYFSNTRMFLCPVKYQQRMRHIYFRFCPFWEQIIFRGRKSWLETKSLEPNRNIKISFPVYQCVRSASINKPLEASSKSGFYLQWPQHLNSICPSSSILFSASYSTTYWAYSKSTWRYLLLCGVHSPAHSICILRLCFQSKVFRIEPQWQLTICPSHPSAKYFL